MATAEIRYRYDEQLASQATRRILSRYNLSAVIALLVTVLFALQRMPWPALTAGILTLVYAWPIVRYRGNAKKLARRLGCPEVTVRVDETGISFSMPSQQSTSAWSQTRALWRFDDVWLFFPYYSVTAACTAIPVAAMTDEFRELVLAGLRAGGATVR
jgi:hypothetical protein